MAEGVLLISGMAMSASCLPTVLPRWSPLYSRGVSCPSVENLSQPQELGVEKAKAERPRLGVGGVRERRS